MPDLLCVSCQSPLPADAAFCMRCGAQSPTVLSSGAVTPSPPPPSEPSVQDKLSKALGNKYEVRRLLGQGGFAEVYEVWDKDLQRRLAVKVLKPDIAWSSGMLERFKQEARAIARLNHPNILPIHFVGDGEGLVYYAMPFVEGQSLGALLRSQGALAPERALAIAKPILDALAHAHENGLVHRDIKPDNVMIEASSGRALLVDFGIAKQITGTPSKMTQTGFVVGTPQYMSPEQALGQGDIDARTDIYAMGAMLYQMVTGAPPYDGETSQEIVGKHLTEPVPIPTNKNAKIPKYFSDIIVRCLAKRPAERFQSASQVLDALNDGRKSGSQAEISAERVAKRINADDATEVMPSSERKAAGPPGAPPDKPPPTTQSPEPRPDRSFLTIPIVLLGGAVVAVAAAVYLLFFGAATLTLENRLIDPIKVTLNTETLQVAPGGSLTRKIPRGQRLVAQWFLVRPVFRNGNPMGSDMQGTLADEKPRGKIHWAVDSRSAGSPYFAPLITNATNQGLGIRINAGLAGAVDCYCPVLPGVVREHIGYYPLFLNSSVQAYALDGSVATFKDLGAEVSKADAAGGSVGLRFEGKDLRQR